MTYEKIVEKVTKIFAKAKVENKDTHIAYVVRVDGEGEGTFYIEIKDGSVNVAPYNYDGNNLYFATDSKVLFSILEEKTDIFTAYNEGKVYDVSADLSIFQALIDSKPKKASTKKASTTKKAATTKKATTAKKATAAKKTEAKADETKAATKKTATAKKATATKATATKKADAKADETKTATTKKATTAKKTTTKKTTK
ncbi:hypothetical protein SAMN02910289_01937 [Lachnospiraceae bacterium RM5]|nr:hypothetical protein SAMN02910289_01937 [Lachnospiraceae bacterium RM5]